MWAGNSKCCGLTWNLSLKWGFNGEIVVESVFICVHNHPQWLSKFKSLTNLIPWDLNCWDTKGPSWSFLLVGTEHQQFLLFYLVCIEGWVLMWLLMSIWALWFSSSKIDPGMLLVDDKTSDKTFLMMFLGEYLAAWDTWSSFLSSGVGLALWRFTMRWLWWVSMRHLKNSFIYVPLQEVWLNPL